MVPSLPLVLKTAANPEGCACGRRRRKVGLQSTESGVASTRPRPKSGVGMRKIMLFAVSAAVEVRLRKSAAEGVGTSSDGVKTVHAAVRGALGILDKAGFADGAGGGDERRDSVGRAV